MNAREYLQKFPRSQAVTFVVSESVPRTAAPGFDYRYRTTSVRCAGEWLESESFGLDLLVINADHPPVDITGTWQNWYKSGHLRCAMVTTEADLLLHYGEKQGRRMIEFYKEEVK